MTTTKIENRAAFPVTWNTGRAYGPDGQPITARIVGGFAYFNDVNRMILGKIDLAGQDIKRADLESFVMSEYDAGRYSMATHFPTDAQAQDNAQAQDKAAPDAHDCQCRECGDSFDSLSGALQICPRCYPVERDAQAPALAPLLAALDSSYNATQGHPDSDALRVVIEAAQARPVVYELTARPRSYVCGVCGKTSTHVTNHTGPHDAPCDSCSWRGGRDLWGRFYTAQDKGRPHTYIGPNPRGIGETNAHAQAAQNMPFVGDTLANGATVLAVKGEPGRAFVLAFTGKGRATPFVVWRVDGAQKSGPFAVGGGDYHKTLSPALAAFNAR